MEEKIKEICNKLNREQLSVHGATEELLNLFSVSKSESIEREPAVCDHHWLGVGDWDGYSMEQCTKCNLFRETN